MGQATKHRGRRSTSKNGDVCTGIETDGGGPLKDVDCCIEELLLPRKESWQHSSLPERHLFVAAEGAHRVRAC